MNSQPFIYSYAGASTRTAQRWTTDGRPSARSIGFRTHSTTRVIQLDPPSIAEHVVTARDQVPVNRLGGVRRPSDPHAEDLYSGNLRAGSAGNDGVQAGPVGHDGFRAEAAGSDGYRAGRAGDDANDDADDDTDKRVSAGNARDNRSTPVQLLAQTLGTFRLTVRGVVVDSWPTGRSQSILKYLLAHHRRNVSRDELMEVSWPDADPDKARNRLYNAISMLRSTLAAAAHVNLIQHNNGAYRLAPSVLVWLDSDEFESAVQQGLTLDTAGDSTNACAAFERGLALYQGDFLADDRYEDWPTAMRTYLGQLCLTALNRLSEVRLAENRFSDSERLCHRILNLDPCHETAHIRLMCGYARQGLYAQAIRQFHLCLAALEDLGCAPGAELAALGRRLYEHEPV